MNLKIHIIDAFTTNQFKGNPAAVISLIEWFSEEQMQSIANENNLSETAFYVHNPSGAFDIRWFSPISEVDFCGHATLASAYVIFNENPEWKQINFCAKAVGTIMVKKLNNGLIEMCFPNREPVEIKDIPLALKEGLSILPQFYLINQQAYFAIYEFEDQIKQIIPNIEKLKTLAPLDVVVSAAGKKYDFVSRYFWPSNGGIEDPVTGSIHAGLAPYWSKRLNKTNLIALQASARSGILYCRVEQNNVYVSGNCVSYLEGIISV